MAHLIICAVIWIVVLLTIPTRRIIQLKYAAILAFFWMLLLDNLSSWLEFYSYTNALVSIGNASLFQLLIYPGVGLLMLNWLTDKPLSKLLSILIVASCFSIVQFVYMQNAALVYERLDMVISFIYSIAALSVYMWLSLAIVGEHTIYSGIKTKRIIMSS